ncbi:MAG: hypothetical protein C0418_01260 [Coriobacteriaceae bacterium]|nr:hypothetical protein [Coriobacteriaceae bacterium]
MDLERLEKQGLVRREAPDPHAARAALDRAERDLRTAQNLLGVDPDWAFAIAYDAGLQACLATMSARGYRARSFDRHRTAIRFLAWALGEPSQALDALDDIRQKRHTVIYDLRGSTSTTEAERAISVSRAVLGAAREHLT